MPPPMRMRVRDERVRYDLVYFSMRVEQLGELGERLLPQCHVMTVTR